MRVCLRYCRGIPRPRVLIDRVAFTQKDLNHRLQYAEKENKDSRKLKSSKLCARGIRWAKKVDPYAKLLALLPVLHW